MRKRLLQLVAVAGLGGICSAAPFVLDFEGIAAHPHDNSSIFVETFYNGGTSSNGTAGPNYGVTFDAPTLLVCLNTLTDVCSNASRGGQGDPGSQLGAVFFLTSNAITMNVTGGFDTGFSFLYTAINSGGSVSVYDGLNGTGNLLTTLNLPITTSGPCPGYSAAFCPFSPIGVGVAGTAQSVGFGGVGNQIAFDDITFGSVTPGDPSSAVPEPSTFLLLSGGMLAIAAGRSRRMKNKRS
jgi:hypothetical protein